MSIRVIDCLIFEFFKVLKDYCDMQTLSDLVHAKGFTLAYRYCDIQNVSTVAPFTGLTCSMDFSQEKTTGPHTSLPHSLFLWGFLQVYVNLYIMRSLSMSTAKALPHYSHSFSLQCFLLCILRYIMCSFMYSKITVIYKGLPHCVYVYGLSLYIYISVCMSLCSMCSLLH